MKLKISTKLFAGFLVISLLFVGVVVINYQLSRKVLRNARQVQASQRVFTDASTLLRNIVDMETGFRGYMLVGKEEVLEPYHQGERYLLNNFSILLSELPSRGVQHARIVRARHMFRDWLNYSHLLISEKREAMRRNPTQEGLQDVPHRQLAESLQGKYMMDQIRVLFAGFDREEQKQRPSRAPGSRKAFRKPA